MRPLFILSDGKLYGPFTDPEDFAQEIAAMQANGRNITLPRYVSDEYLMGTCLVKDCKNRVNPKDCISLYGLILNGALCDYHNRELDALMK